MFMLFVSFAMYSKASIFIVDDLGVKYLYEDKYIAGKNAFLIGSNQKNKVKLNNLAYVSRLRNDLIYRATIQMLILKESNNKNYYLTDGYNIIDTKEEEKLIEDYLKRYETINTCDNKTYNVNYQEDLTLNCGVNLYTYYIDNSYVMLGNNNKLKANKGGIQKINFTHESLAILDNYIYANDIFYEDFEITLNVLANKVKFNIKTFDNHDFKFNYGIYNESGELIEKIDLKTGYNEIYFAKGTNIYLKELTENSIYLLDEDKLFLDSKDTYEIEVIKEPKKFNVVINTYDRNMYYDDYFKDTYTDVTIYDKNYNFYTNLKCEESCNIDLPSGTYIFEDNISKFRELWVIEGDMDVNMYRYLLNGIKCNDKIDSISKDSKNINFTNNGIMYIFDDVMTSGVYDITIDGKKYSVNLSNYNNYIYIRNIGTLYELKIDMKDNNIDDMVIDIPLYNEESIDKITVDIPDTYINVLKSDKYVFFKKRINYYFNIVYNYIN